MVEVLDCKCIKEQELTRLKKEISSPLTLAVIQIGKFKENELYLRNKEILAKNLGVCLFFYSFDDQNEKEEIIEQIKKLNKDPNINGMMIQKPILPNYCYQELVDFIDVRKDVDCVTSFNKKNWKTTKGFLPCTTKSILKILNYYHITLENKKVTILGRSDLSTMPIYEIYKEKSDITLCNSKTENIKDKIKNSDIVISAIGKPCYFTKDYFREGQVIIDVGINFQDGKIVGDIDSSSLEESSYNLKITKVPGGVGMLTPLYLFDNLLYASKIQKRK